MGPKRVNVCSGPLTGDRFSLHVEFKRINMRDIGVYYATKANNSQCRKSNA
jgi:hypothetical protein